MAKALPSLKIFTKPQFKEFLSSESIVEVEDPLVFFLVSKGYTGKPHLLQGNSGILS